MAPQDYQDSNPYSRNLILISLGIIIFNFADGQLMNNHLKLHVINIKFNNIEFFSYLIWILFFWFLFRFWQSCKFKMNDIIFDSNLNSSYMNNKRLVKYVELKTGLKYRDKENGFWGITLDKDKILPLNKNAGQLSTSIINLKEKDSNWLIVYISLCKDVLIKDMRALEAYVPYIISLIAFYSTFSCYILSYF